MHDLCSNNNNATNHSQAPPIRIDYSRGKKLRDENG